MPIYEYKCSCGQTFEKLIPLQDRDKLQKCECGLEGKRIDISKSSFRLKGKWFKTTGSY